MSINAIFLDWFNTLSNSVFWYKWNHPNHTNYSDFRRIETALFKNSLQIVNDWMVGKYSSETVVELLAHSTGVSYAKLWPAFVDSCQNLQIHDPKVLNVIDSLRRQGYFMGIATDNMDSFTRFTVPALELCSHFDGIYNSHTLLARKRDFSSRGESLFFTKVFNELSLLPANTVLIDDSEDQGGRLAALGINYMQVSGPAKAIEILKQFQR